MVIEKYEDKNTEELAKLLTGNEKKDSTVLGYFLKKIDELILSGDTSRVQKILKPLMYLYGYEYDWLRMDYFISLTTTAEKEECIREWEEKISYYNCTFHIKNFSIPASSAWFMLGDLMIEPHLKCKDCINDPWFIKAKELLKSESEKDPKNYYVLNLLLVTSATPTEYLLNVKRLIELDPSPEKECFIVNSIGNFFPIKGRDYISSMVGLRHETIRQTLFRLLRENIIADKEDKQKAEEIIRLFYKQFENRESSTDYWELLYYCQIDEAGKIECMKKILEIDPDNLTAKLLNRTLENKVAVLLHQCGICGHYVDILKEGLCDNCYKNVDHSWEDDAMDTYCDLADPNGDGTNIFEE